MSEPPPLGTHPMTSERDKQFTPLDVLRAFEGHFPSPNAPHTFDESQLDSKGAVCRLQRLKALFRAYDLPLDPKAFRSGEFIALDDTRYEPVMAAWAKEMAPALQDHPSRDSSQLQRVFENFYAYWSSTRSARSTFDWILACSGYVAHLLETVAYPTVHAVGGALAPIEQVLVTLVDPQGRTFTKGELVDNYGYPDADPPGIFDEIIEEWEAEDAEYEKENPDGGPTP